MDVTLQLSGIKLDKKDMFGKSEYVFCMFFENVTNLQLLFFYFLFLVRF